MLAHDHRVDRSCYLKRPWMNAEVLVPRAAGSFDAFVVVGGSSEVVLADLVAAAASMRAADPSKEPEESCVGCTCLEKGHLLPQTRVDTVVACHFGMAAAARSPAGRPGASPGS
jgi:hypothetical protein